MAKSNATVLIDEIIRNDYGDETWGEGEQFLCFALDMVLKSMDLTEDEVDDGIVDGHDDGGVDAIHILVNGIPRRAIEEVEIRSVKTIDALVSTIKRQERFTVAPLIALKDTLSKLLALDTEDHYLAERYNDALVSRAKLLHDLIIGSASNQPRVSFQISYITRGDAQDVSEHCQQQAREIAELTEGSLQDCSATFSFVGSRELLTASRRRPDLSLTLEMLENAVSRAASNYLGLVRLSEFLRFITDDDGKMRHYLFESNVRDYMGENYVNTSIENTLRRNSDPEQEDFWWLNNGITIIGDSARVLGKSLEIDNVQIVNGLQTAESIYRNREHINGAGDDRAILVKVLAPKDPRTVDHIIRSTNNQTAVDATSLRATDAVQRDIEDAFRTVGLFYDRRRNYYRNRGIPAARIVTVSYVLRAMVAIWKRSPFEAFGVTTRVMQTTSEYRQVFSTKTPVQLFPAVTRIARAVERGIPDRLKGFLEYRRLYRFLYACLYVECKLGTRGYSPDDIIALSEETLDEELLERVHKILYPLIKQGPRGAGVNPKRKPHRSEKFYNKARKNLGLR
jgi:AIPR protein